MIKTLKLKVLAVGTEFTYQNTLWKRSGWGNSEKVECTPKYGGQWQEELKEFLSLDIDVTIKADRF